MLVKSTPEVQQLRGIELKAKKLDLKLLGIYYILKQK